MRFCVKAKFVGHECLILDHGIIDNIEYECLIVYNYYCLAFGPPCLLCSQVYEKRGSPGVVYLQFQKSLQVKKALRTNIEKSSRPRRPAAGSGEALPLSGRTPRNLKLLDKLGTLILGVAAHTIFRSSLFTQLATTKLGFDES
ncbi:hypothetical protein H5410_024245 [Solanum commersonii]|uniref:Uncharacterized protein n=1 Tax=Solanum commersonii TaxID=4109 RepID=A0A9J5ZLG2_SOLCO|nr:hypothetical protein H5410_024245 [Solanum commersonii]